MKTEIKSEKPEQTVMLEVSWEEIADQMPVKLR